MFTTLIPQLAEWLGAAAVAWILSLSPRLKYPPVGFKYARRDGITALMLFGLILILAFVFYSINPPEFPAEIRPTPAPVANLDQALLVAAIALALFGVALVARRQPIRSLGWRLQAGSPEEAGVPAGVPAGAPAAGKAAERRPNRQNKPNRTAAQPAAKRQNIFMPALQTGIALAILTIILRNRVMDVLGGLDAAEAGLLLQAIGISLAEETIFRGYIQQRLAWWLGEWRGIGLTAGLFTLWHVPAWLGRVPLETGLLITGLTLVQGLMLGWIMSKAKNVIAPALYRSVSLWINFIG